MSRRLPFGVARFRFTVPMQAPANSLDDDDLETLANNAVISSLARVLLRSPPSAAGVVHVHRALLQNSLLPGCTVPDIPR
jgi:hypothetical protein